MSHTSPIAYGTAVYLAVVQFLFVSTWTVYVAFLPGLLEAAGPDADAVQAASRAPLRRGAIAAFVAAMAVGGFGFQMHSFLQSPPLYLRYASPADLPWLLPIFWVGFSIAMFCASGLTKRYGPPAVMAVSALVGSVGLVIAQTATNLAWTIVGQLAAGGAWGSLMAASFTAAARFGHVGREGFMIGAVWSTLSAATLLRLAGVGSGFIASFGSALAWLPAALWGLSGALAWIAYRLTAGGEMSVAHGAPTRG